MPRWATVISAAVVGAAFIMIAVCESAAGAVLLVLVLLVLVLVFLLPLLMV